MEQFEKAIKIYYENIELMHNIPKGYSVQQVLSKLCGFEVCDTWVKIIWYGDFNRKYYNKAA